MRMSKARWHTLRNEGFEGLAHQVPAVVPDYSVRVKVSTGDSYLLRGRARSYEEGIWFRYHAEPERGRQDHELRAERLELLSVEDVDVVPADDGGLHGAVDRPPAADRGNPAAREHAGRDTGEVGHSPAGVGDAHELLATGRLGGQDLITAEYPLEALPEALARHQRGDGTKFAIIPSMT